MYRGLFFSSGNFPMNFVFETVCKHIESKESKVIHKSKERRKCAVLLYKEHDDKVLYYL